MSTSQVTIERADPADAAEIHAMKMLAFAEEGRLSGTVEIPPLQEDVASVDRDICSNTVLVARLDGLIVGSARGTATGDRCEIRSVCVHPSFHGRGIGGALMRAIEQAHPDAARFELTTNTLVPGNVEFYERRGYRIFGHTRFTETIVVAHLAKHLDVVRNAEPSSAEG